jgi:hypothetical protein
LIISPISFDAASLIARPARAVDSETVSGIGEVIDLRIQMILLRRGTAAYENVFTVFVHRATWYFLGRAVGASSDLIMHLKVIRD